MSNPGALEDVLRRLAGGDPDGDALTAALATEAVLVPGGGQDGTEIQLQVVEMEDGGQAVPLFSSAERMQEVGGPAEGTAIPFSVLAADWPDGIDAVFDPGHPWAVRIPAAAVPEVGMRTEPRVRQHPTGEAPTEILEAAAGALGKVPAVDAAWSALVTYPDREDKREHLLIGIHLTDPEAQDDLVEAMREALGAYRDGPQPLEMALLQPGDDDIVTLRLLSGEPFYAA